MSGFAKGDLVKLKSGSPTMTVQECVEALGKYRCQWFSGSKLNSGDFHPWSLEKVEADSDGTKR